MWPTTAGLRPEHKNLHLEGCGYAKTTLLYTTTNKERNGMEEWKGSK